MTLDWVRVNREDGETVGWLEPLDVGFELLQPRDVLGHPVGGPQDWTGAEEAVQEAGLAFLAEQWLLDGDPSPRSIVEVSSEGIVVAPAVALKALAPAERVTVRWPDTQGRLRRA